MAEPGIALHAAIFTALSGNLGSGVALYDHVPQDSAYPYVVMDAQEVQSRDFLSERLDERNVYLSIWSEYRGQKEVLEIIAAIDAALHNARLPMETGRMVICKVTRKRTSLDADGVTYMGAVTLSMMVEH